MRVVVTGGAGFLGSHLCEALVRRGDSVVCVDDLSTGRLENMLHLMQNRAFSFVRGDVSHRVDVAGRVDAVLHLASPAARGARRATSPTFTITTATGAMTWSRSWTATTYQRSAI